MYQYKRICVSLSLEEADFMKQNNLNPSKILQRAIKNLQNGEQDKEYWVQKAYNSIKMVDTAMRYMEKRGEINGFLEYKRKQDTREFKIARDRAKLEDN